MSNLEYSNAKETYCSCYRYNYQKGGCGRNNEKVPLYDVADLTNHYYTTDRQIVATELELLASRCRKDKTQIKSICPKHRSEYTWKKDKKVCKITDCQSKTNNDCVRAGKNASIEIQKFEHYNNFPILGYVCSKCQQRLSTKYQIHGYINEHSLWEIQLPLSEKNSSSVGMANHPVWSSPQNSLTSGQSPSAYNYATINVQKTNDDGEHIINPGMKYSCTDSTQCTSDMYPLPNSNESTLDNCTKHAKHMSNAISKPSSHNIWEPNSYYPSESKHPSQSSDRHHASLSHWSSATHPGLQGLRNLGNTCFMNSALQCLIHVPELQKVFLSSDWKKCLNPKNPLGSGGKVAETFAGLIKSIWSPHSNTAIVSPIDFKNSIAKFNRIFAGYDQQDPFQLLNSVLDALHEDLKIDERNDSSPISKLFHGYTISVIKCSSCSYEHTPDPDVFSSLSLNIPNKSPFNLHECFNEMSDVQYPTDDSKWYCSNCNRFSKSTTEIFVQTLPSILIVHFKRFNYDPESYVHIDTFIDYPLILKFDKHTTPGIPKAEYELISVCLKVGSLRGGHAYAYAKLENGEWYCFNDSSVTPIHENTVITKHAYILTYRQLKVSDPKHNLYDSPKQNTMRTNTHYNSATVSDDSFMRSST